ncbi:MAG: hypothetical protein M3229_02315 [Actinomycetota bacterium]|nr:hypothetical protein [Actinomycetota bacterium]
MPPTLAAQVLLAGIAERGADAAGYAHRGTSTAVHVRKQRSGASALLRRIELPHETRQLLVHVRDYTKGHPRIQANNHPIRHGAVVGVHNGVILNDDELFARHGWKRAEPEMTVDSEAIFALVGAFESRAALEQLRGSLATAWLDERRPELFLARGVGRPLWVARGRDETFFASTRGALDLVERCLGVELAVREVPDGSLVTVSGDGELRWTPWEPDTRFEERQLPAVRAPHEGESCLRLLPALVAAAL